MKKIVIGILILLLNCSYAFSKTLSFDDLEAGDYNDSFRYSTLTIETFSGSHIEVTGQTADGFGNANSLPYKLSVRGEEPFVPKEKSRFLIHFDFPVQRASFWLSGTFHDVTVNAYDAGGALVATYIETYPIPSGEPLAPDGNPWDFYYDRELRFVNIEAPSISEITIQPSEYDGFSIDDFSFDVSCVGGEGSPTALAGDDINANANSLVTLDGGESYDDDGTIILHQWFRLPDMTLLCDGESPTCQFRTHGLAEELIELRVIDSVGNCSSDTISIFHNASTNPPICGNENTEEGEVCDSDSIPCTATGGYNGFKTCNAQCSDYGACVTTESCGDGVLNGPEACDDGSENGQAGKCNSTCSGMTPSESECGNNIVEEGEQCDDGPENGQVGKCNATCSGQTGDPSSVKIWIEAENYDTIVPPMQVDSDPTASGGNFIQVPKAGRSKFTPNDVMATYNINITQPGNYVLWGRVIAVNGLSDSFFVLVDDDEFYYWQVERGSVWQWDQVNDRTLMDPVILDLSAGTRVIKIIRRDYGTQLDKLLLTNDLDFIPSGLGE